MPTQIQKNVRWYAVFPVYGCRNYRRDPKESYCKLTSTIFPSTSWWRRMEIAVRTTRRGAQQSSSRQERQLWFKEEVMRFRLCTKVRVHGMRARHPNDHSWKKRKEEPKKPMMGDRCIRESAGKGECRSISRVVRSIINQKKRRAGSLRWIAVVNVQSEENKEVVKRTNIRPRPSSWTPGIELSNQQRQRVRAKKGGQMGGTMGGESQPARQEFETKKKRTMTHVGHDVEYGKIPVFHGCSVSDGFELKAEL
ncbi:hypothetical protein CPB86DRAFT_796642 [Serendipita vermifera]|nr:hypothetical protein CPB86DRAFT_796642 [Serendipita vermifera]